MATTANAQSTLDAFRAAVESKDYDALESLYADDAAVTTFSERNRPSSATELRGPRAVGQAYREAPGDLTHEVSDEVVADDRFACTLKCEYPTGELVLAAIICTVGEGRITRQVGVEAWDE